MRGEKTMPITHKWNGTILEITSDSGTTAVDLKGEKGDTGARGARGLQGERGGGATIEDGIISSDTTWSSAAIMDNFAEQLATVGNPVECRPIPNYPLHVITEIEPYQEGSGTASPNNIRPIRGMNTVNVVRCGNNLTPFAMTGNTYSVNGVSGSFDNNGIVVSGKPTADYTKLVTQMITLPNGKYYVSGGDTKKAYLQVVISYPDTIQYYSNTEFTIDGTETHISIMIQTGKITDVGTLNNYRIYPMLICGSSAATVYESYNGNKYTLSIGEDIYSGSLDWNTGELLVKYISIDEYAGETITGNYISSTGGLHTGSQIVYELEEPYTIQLEPQEIIAIKGQNILYTDAAQISVLGRVDTMYQLSQIIDRIAALEAAIIEG